MTFIGWIEFPSMMYAIHQSEEGFACIKYSNGNKVSGAEFSCETVEQLQDFLLSIPNSNENDITSLLMRVKNTKRK